MDLSRFCDSWDKDEFGVYHSRHASALSYPEDGNSSCFAVEENSFWFQHRNKVIQTVVSRFPFQQPFVDVGGGNGFVSLGLQKQGHSVVLVEPGPMGAQNAKKRGVEHVVQGLWGTEYVKSQSAGAIGLFDVVEHIEDDVGFLTDIQQTLVEHGLVFITVPAFNFLWSSEDKFAGHFRRYTSKRLKEVLESAGFELLFSTYFFQVLVMPVFVTRTLPSALGLRRTTSTSLTRQEHVPKDNFLTRVVLSQLGNELHRIESGKSLRWGSSLFTVAKKRP